MALALWVSASGRRVGAPVSASVSQETRRWDGFASGVWDQGGGRDRGDSWLPVLCLGSAWGVLAWIEPVCVKLSGLVWSGLVKGV